MTNRVIFATIFAFLGILNLNCESAGDIQNLEWIYLKYNSLPDTIKYYFFENLKPQSNNSFPRWNEAFTINLDSPRSTISWKTTGLHGFYPGKTYFYINDDSYYYSSTSQKIARPPFILFNDQLFFCNTKNITNEEEIGEATYVKIDLQKYNE